MRARFFRFVLATLLLCAAPYLCAQDGLEGALKRANLTAPFGPSLFSRSTLATADFDGDSKPDGALLVASDGFSGQKFRIELHLTGHPNGEIIFASPEAALTVVARDLNHDGYPDVIVEQTYTRKRFQVWLNDGQGSFHKGRTEDFPADTQSRDQLQKYFYPLDNPALSLPSQRGFEQMMLKSCHVAGRPPSSGEFSAPLIIPPSSSQVPSPNASRAPPLFQSL